MPYQDFIQTLGRHPQDPFAVAPTTRTPGIDPGGGGSHSALPQVAAQGAGYLATLLSGGTIQPWMIPLLTSGASAIYRSLNPSRAMQIRDKVLNSQLEMRDMIARRAFGPLTPQDVADIREGGEAHVQAVAGNVASRGLGTSPAGAQVVSEAQQNVFAQARREAQSQLPILDNQVLASANAQLMNDSSFVEDLGQVASLIAQELQEDPAAATDPELMSIVRQIYDLVVASRGA